MRAQVQLRVPGAGSEYLADPATVNARLQDVVAGARTEILAAQPGGPRSRDLLEVAVARDSAALDRGVELRTVYRDTVRDHPVTAEYARTMSARTGGRPARYATLVGDFERMIIVDRQQAFVSDHIVAGADAHAAWLVTDLTATAQADTAWGAPDTDTPVTGDDTASSTPADTGTTVTPLDTAWG